MVALVVVLGEDLPVGSHGVGVAPGHVQPRHLVGGHHLVQGAQRLLEGCRRAGAVHEDQAVPLGTGKRGEAVVGGIEPVEVLEPGGCPHRTLERVRPGVVGADDSAVVGRHPAGQQLVAPVAADVGEGPEHLVLTPEEQHAGDSQGLGPLVARSCHRLAAPHAHPPALEEVALLPGEDLRVHVGGAGEHPAVAEGPERGIQRTTVQRGGLGTGLNDHTVNPMIRTGPRPAPLVGAPRAHDVLHVTLGPDPTRRQQGVNDGSRGPRRGSDGQGRAGLAGHHRGARPRSRGGRGEGPGLRGVPHRPPLPRGRDQRRVPLPVGPRGSRCGGVRRARRDLGGTGGLRGPQLAGRLRPVPVVPAGTTLVLLRHPQCHPADDTGGRYAPLPRPRHRRLRREDTGGRRPVHQGRPGGPT